MQKLNIILFEKNGVAFSDKTYTAFTHTKAFVVWKYGKM